MAFEMRITDGTNVLFSMSDRINSLVMPVATAVPSAGSEQDATVNEYLELLMIGGRVTAVANARTLTRLLEDAFKYYNDRIGVQLYLEKLNLTEVGEVWMRSHLLGGTVLDDVDMAIRSGKMHCRVSIARKNYWEAVTEVQIPVSNTNVSNNISGITVWNCSDNMGSIPNRRVNWFQIAGAAVLGNIPAACRLELTSTFNNAARISTVWVSHNVYSDPANFTHIIEGEASLHGTVETVAGMSGNPTSQSISTTWSGSGETRLFDWTLSTAFLNRCRGNQMAILARLTATPAADLFVRMRVKASLTTIYESGPQLLNQASYIQELPTLRLPPYLIREGNLYPLTLELYGQRNTAGSSGLGLDFLQISPTDSWRKLQPFGYSLGYLARLVDDGINDEIYTDSWSTAGKFGNYMGLRSPIRLIPGKDQRLYFLADNDLSGSVITQTMSAKIYYRPRWRSI